MRRYIGYAILGAATVLIVAVCVGWMDPQRFVTCGMGMMLVDLIDRRLI